MQLSAKPAAALARYLVLARSKRKQVHETTSNILAAHIRIFCLDKLPEPASATLKLFNVCIDKKHPPLDEGHPLIKIASSF